MESTNKKKTVSYHTDIILINSTTADNSTQDNQSQTHEESYLSELLAETQVPPTNLSTLTAEELDSPTYPPKHPNNPTGVLPHQFHNQLKFSDDRSFSLGPETQRARLSMENNARLIQQELSNDHSTLFSHFQSDPLNLISPPPHQQSLPTKQEDPAFEEQTERSIPVHQTKQTIRRLSGTGHDQSSSSDDGQDRPIPLQSTYPEQGARSPHPPDVTIDLAFEQADQSTYLEHSNLFDSEQPLLPVRNSQLEPVSKLQSTPISLTKSTKNRPPQTSPSSSPPDPPSNTDLPFNSSSPQHPQPPDSASQRRAHIPPLRGSSQPSTHHDYSNQAEERIPSVHRAKSTPIDGQAVNFEKNQDHTIDSQTVNSSLTLASRQAAKNISSTHKTTWINHSISSTQANTNPEDSRTTEAVISKKLEHEQTDQSTRTDKSLPPHPQRSSPHPVTLPDSNKTAQTSQLQQTEVDENSTVGQAITDSSLQQADSETQLSRQQNPMMDEHPSSPMRPQRVDDDLNSQLPFSFLSSSRNDTTELLPEPKETDQQDSSAAAGNPGPLSSRPQKGIHTGSQKRKRLRHELDQEPNSALSKTGEEDLIRLETLQSRNSSSMGQAILGEEPVSLSAPIPTRKSSDQNSTSTKPSKPPSTARRSSTAVSVVIPRFRKSRAPLPPRPKVPRAPPPAPSDTDTPLILPVPRVLAYRSDWEAFAPGEVCSVTPDKVIVRYDDQSSEPRDLGQLRLCHIRVGDVVKYIGTDLADGESQMTTVREPKRVLRVEKAEESEGTLINSRRDLLVTCDENDYASQPSLEGSSVRSESRFLVEAVMVLPSGPRRHTGLKDRMLPQQILDDIRELMKAHSGVGMRAKLAVPQPGRSNPLVGIFQGFGILLTGAAATTTTLEPKPASRKRTQSSSSRGLIEQQIREHLGTVIGKVDELYELKGSDLNLDRSLSTPARTLSPAVETNSSYRLSPASKHDKLRTILLVAETPVKTLKYLMALALGIPCVSTKWVTHSCEQGYALDWDKYMIGAGPSIFLGAVPALVNLQIPILSRASHDLKAIFASRDSLEILKNKSIIYVSSKSKSKSDWNETVKPILCASGARRVGFAEARSLEEVMQRGGLNGIDYVLLEDHLSVASLPTTVRPHSTGPKRRKFARTVSASSSNTIHSNPSPLPPPPPQTFRIVDFEWLKQSLIYGRVLTPQFFAQPS